MIISVEILFLYPRNLVWLYLKRWEKLNKMEKKWVSFIGEEPQLKVLEELNNEILQMIRERNPAHLEDWLDKCEQSEVVYLQTPLLKVHAESMVR